MVSKKNAEMKACESLDEKKRLSSETSLSLVHTTENSDTLGMAGKNDLKNKFNEKWTASWAIGAV